MWDKDLLKEWNEIEEKLGIVAFTTIREYVGKLLVKNAELRDSRDLWRAKYQEKHHSNTKPQPDNI